MEALTVVIAEDKTADLFGGFPGLPVTFIVDREGKYYSKHMGLVSKEDIEEEIQTLLRQDSNAKPATAGEETTKQDDASAAGPKS